MLRKLFLAISTRPPLTLSDTSTRAVVVNGPGEINFIAMEYYLGILNRTYLVSGFNGGLGGARVAGVITNPTRLAPDLAADPLTFANTSLINEYKTVSFDSPNFLAMDSANFFYPAKDVVSIATNMTRKWGMGNVRYSGRIVITLVDRRTREFILLGSQDVQGVADRLRALVSGESARPAQHVTTQ